MQDSMYVIIVVFLVMIGMAGLWAIDLAVSAMNVGGELGNGFYQIAPGQLYHIGLGLEVVVLFTFSFLGIKKIMEGKGYLEDE